MDHFGIGNAINAMTKVLFITARRSGRTTSLLDNLKDGDRVCCSQPREAQQLQRLCLQRGLKVECISLDPKRADHLFERGPSQGRTIFEHTWVEQYYDHALARARNEIDLLQEQASGEGAPHIETRRQAQAAGWRW